MGKKIVVINGHPDSRPERFCAALAGAYVAGAVAAGHTVRRIDVGALAPAPIRSMQDFAGEPPPAIRQVQENIAWAEHLVLLYPLWLGGPPAVLKAFFEQVFRYGFALGGEGRSMRGLLKGKSARVIVTDTAGGRYEAFVPYVLGYPSHPMARADVEAKATELMAPALGAARVRTVIARCREIETLKSGGDLARLIAT